MGRFRLSDAAWLLLKRLNEQHAELSVCGDPNCYRFHVVREGVRGEVVRNMTMEALVGAGFLQRSRDCSPSYKVAKKGLQALRRKGLWRPDHEISFFDGEEPAGQSSSFQQAMMS